MAQLKHSPPADGFVVREITSQGINDLRPLVHACHERVLGLSYDEEFTIARMKGTIDSANTYIFAALSSNGSMGYVWAERTSPIDLFIKQLYSESWETHELLRGAIKQIIVLHGIQFIETLVPLEPGERTFFLEKNPRVRLFSTSEGFTPMSILLKRHITEEDLL